MVKFIWKLKGNPKVKNGKLQIMLFDKNSNKTKNATGPGIYIQNYINKLGDVQLKEDIIDCLQQWDGESSFSNLLSEYINLKYKSEIQLEEIKEDDDIFEEKQIKYPKINKEVFTFFKNDFVEYSKLHEDLLKEGLRLFSELIKEERYKEFRENVYFRGGTSLYFRYNNFYRFSKDLDFSVNYIYNKGNSNVSNNFIYELKELMQNSDFSVHSCIEFQEDLDIVDGKSRTLIFLDEFGKERDIKFDTMGSANYEIVDLKIDDFIIKSSSSLDTLCNKLLRQTPIDLTDITYIISKEKYTLEDIRNCLKIKAEKETIPLESFLNKIKSITKFKNYDKWLPFVQDL